MFVCADHFNVDPSDILIDLDGGLIAEGAGDSTGRRIKKLGVKNSRLLVKKLVSA